MICSNAIELIKQLDRTSEDTLPPYNTDNVRLVLHEMKSLFDQNVEIVNSSRDHIEDAMFALKIRHKALKRNKRCLLAYLWNRMERIKEMRWQIGSILPPEMKSNLSPSEEQWLANYSKSLASYMKTIGPDGGLNLLQDLKPPKSLYVVVRSLVDVGRIELDDGEVVILKKDAQYMMLRSQCESLIHQGIHYTVLCASRLFRLRHFQTMKNKWKWLHISIEWNKLISYPNRMSYILYLDDLNRLTD